MNSYDKKINQLIKLYNQAEKRLIKIITTKKIKGQVTDFYESLLKQVKVELAKLQIQSIKLSKDIVDNLYREAYTKAINELQIDISDGFSKLHIDAINILTENLINNFAQVNNQVGRKIEDTIRDIGLTNAQMKFATGQTIKQLQKELRESLVNEGIGGITDKRGRVIPFTVYAELLSRSIVAETQNTSVVNVAKEYKHDLVKMTEHKTACPVCQKYEGKIYSISGEDTRYPYLKTIPGFNKGYNNIHPRCRHRIGVYVEKYNKENNSVYDELSVLKYTDSDIIKIKEELKSKGIKGIINIPPKNINAEKLNFDDYHINKERVHNVTKEEALSFIKNAKLSISKWNGIYENYYSIDGIVYVKVDDNLIRTCYKKEEFKGDAEEIREVILKYEKGYVSNS